MSGRQVCARCGSELDIDWLDVSALGSPFDTRMAGRTKCPNYCDPCCPTCQRDVGDIHGAECGPIMWAKVGSLTPCTIDRQDVRLSA